MPGPTPNQVSQNGQEVGPKHQYILEISQVILMSMESEKAQVYVDFETLCIYPVNLW